MGVCRMRVRCVLLYDADSQDLINTMTYEVFKLHQGDLKKGFMNVGNIQFGVISHHIDTFKEKNELGVLNESVVLTLFLTRRHTASEAYAWGFFPNK